MNKTFKKLISIFLAMIFIVTFGLLVGCQTAAGTTAAAEAAGAAKNYKIGFAIQTIENVIWNREIAGEKAQSEKLGIQYTVANADNNVSKQISNIENFITEGKNAIIIHVFDIEAFADIAKKAMDAGIVVCNYDDTIRDGSTGQKVVTDFFLGCDNYEIGYRTGTMAGKWITENLGDQETVEVGLLDYPLWEFLITRANGIKDALAKFAPNAKIVATETGVFTPEGVTVGENWLKAFPNMQVVVGINDGATVGLYEAWKAGGVDIMDPKKSIWGADGITDAVDLIKAGTIFRGSVGLDVFRGGAACIDAAVQAIEGQKPNDVIFPMTDITSKNVDEWMSDPNLYQPAGGAK